MMNDKTHIPKDIAAHNQTAWDNYVTEEVIWTVPVSSEVIAKAREGEYAVSLGANSDVPRNWFPEQLEDVKILCLACGGGQQAPILAAAGAQVTVMDISAKQLEQDCKVAQQEALPLTTIQGDMRDLSAFTENSFDIVFCPVSITYIPNLKPLFSEAYRVLSIGGSFMLGAPNPAIYLFDADKWEEGVYLVSNTLPFNSLDELNEEQRRQFMADNKAIEYSHTLSSIIGGQIEAGFKIDGFYEDSLDESLSRYFKDYFATKAIKG